MHLRKTRFVENTFFLSECGQQCKTNRRIHLIRKTCFALLHLQKINHMNLCWRLIITGHDLTSSSDAFGDNKVSVMILHYHMVGRASKKIRELSWRQRNASLENRLCQKACEMQRLRLGFYTYIVPIDDRLILRATLLWNRYGIEVFLDL